jgi:hypothetical protein
MAMLATTASRAPCPPRSSSKPLIRPCRPSRAMDRRCSAWTPDSGWLPLWRGVPDNIALDAGGNLPER